MNIITISCEILGGGRWGDCHTYHLTINTTDWDIKELVPVAAEFAGRWFGR